MQIEPLAKLNHGIPASSISVYFQSTTHPVFYDTSLGPKKT